MLKFVGTVTAQVTHTKKCTFKQYIDVFNCRQEKRPPGKINKRRLDQDITKQEKAVYESQLLKMCKSRKRSKCKAVFLTLVKVTM